MGCNASQAEQKYALCPTQPTLPKSDFSLGKTHFRELVERSATRVTRSQAEAQRSLHSPKVTFPWGKLTFGSRSNGLQRESYGVKRKPNASNTPQKSLSPRENSLLGAGRTECRAGQCWDVTTGRNVAHHSYY